MDLEIGKHITRPLPAHGGRTVVQAGHNWFVVDSLAPQHGLTLAGYLICEECGTTAIIVKPGGKVACTGCGNRSRRAIRSVGFTLLPWHDLPKPKTDHWWVGSDAWFCYFRQQAE